MFNWIINLFKKKSNKVVKRRRLISDDDFNAIKRERENKMNSILEKISKKGYDSLSQHEKNFLNNYSND
jgi:hypothetical protein